MEKNFPQPKTLAMNDMSDPKLRLLDLKMLTVLLTTVVTCVCLAEVPAGNTKRGTKGFSKASVVIGQTLKDKSSPDPGILHSPFAATLMTCTSSNYPEVVFTSAVKMGC